jgi:hypothetical protein
MHVCANYNKFQLNYLVLELESYNHDYFVQKNCL